MSENQLSPRRADETDSAAPVGDPVGAMWVQPVVTFGIRAAALASLVVPVGMVVGGLVGGGGAGAEAAPMTTCCPERPW
ncbi:hypothetical protein OG777_13265 [Micromonospora peucetia]|uniref:Uncharacterized protein n=1 Tax=Micromonospora peucetia TaxID=47871 RepID=A0A1C6VXR3_9ACTN|nr:hypothetical protein [Micromonospora peucetia]MCX4387898.1 hypothetical protein [Micromonospora peucetia]WSA31394.1 hypothetical protein OIE14_25145 [Micromonospora peucetia]SCL70690.1 hypothetical protein GA0070608_4412 [Micromonospora peucetia]